MLQENKDGHLDFVDVCSNPCAFKVLLIFLYCGQVEFMTTENVYDIYSLTVKLDIQDLRCICVNFMKIHLSCSNFCDICELSLKNSETNLLNAVSDFFSVHFLEIIVSEKWKNFIVQYPLPCNDLLIKSFIPQSNV